MWMHLICNFAWKQKVVREDWVKAINVSLFLGKRAKDGCSNYRGICLFSNPGKVYARLLIDRVMEVTECRTSEEQGGL